MSKQKSRITNWKEQRRLHALKLNQQNWKQSEIATALNVSKGTVSRKIGKNLLKQSLNIGALSNMTAKGLR